MAQFTKITRSGLDRARKTTRMPQTIELLEKLQSGPNKGGYDALYTVDGGWFIYYMSEVVEGQKKTYIAVIITDDRDDLDEEVMSRLSAVKYRGRAFKKKDVRRALTFDPAYWLLVFESTGEKIS